MRKLNIYASGMGKTPPRRGVFILVRAVPVPESGARPSGKKARTNTPGHT